MSDQHGDRRARRAKWCGRISRMAASFIILILVGALSLPLLLSRTPLRDYLLNQTVKDLEVEASTESATLGWSPPSTLEGLHVRSEDGKLNLNVPEVRLDQAWWQLLLSSGRLGHAVVEQPQLTLQLDWSEPQRYSLASIPDFTARFRDADFTLRMASMTEPVISVTGLNVTLSVDDRQGSKLVVEQGRLFDRRPLTPQMCDQLLQLFDPTLGEVVHVEGLFSLDIERLRVPLDVDPREQLEQVDFEGTLYLHEVTTRARSPLLKRILTVALDVHGKPPTDTLRAVEENQIHVQVREGRIYHDKLVLSFPEISPELEVRSQGSVGLDESLDLQLAIPAVVVAENPQQVAPGAMAQFRVTGTVTKPMLERLDGQELPDTAKRAGGPSPEQPSDAVTR